MLRVIVPLHGAGVEGVLDAIIFGDLDAKKDGKDETKHGNDSQDDDVLVAGPVDGEVSFHQFNEAKKGPSTDEEKEGQKDT